MRTQLILFILFIPMLGLWSGGPASAGSAPPGLWLEVNGAPLETVRDGDYLANGGGGRLLRVHEYMSGACGSVQGSMCGACGGAQCTTGSQGLAVFVHGMSGSASQLKLLIAESVKLGIPSYVFVYNDRWRHLWQSGDQLAHAIRRLARPAYALDVRIVATSAGSLVSRWALNVLAASRSYSFGKHLTRFYAIDAPWHGYIGPGDHGLDAFKMFFAQPFLGDGACDVRARSDFFLGTAPADGKPAVPGLLDVVLPASFETRLVFAQQGGQALDYTEDELARLPGLWAEALSQGLSMPAEKLTRRQLNFWHALTSATAMIGLDAQGRELARQGVLSQQSALELWNRAFPRYPGDHVGVLSSPELVRDVGEWLVGTARN